MHDLDLPPGSSPLARGLRTSTAASTRGRGIIPARAGFTCPARTRPIGGPDHPRSRGVYGDHGIAIRFDPGSSPLARGLLAGVDSRAGQGRIIPARAGFTADYTSARGSRTDHPRSRGVYNTTMPLLTLVARIIPARAGFTRPFSASTSPSRDHPRSRGVYDFFRLGAKGSDRIIPARAGFTRKHGKPQSEPKDHPRSRGVYDHTTRRWGQSTGSSPLARGLQAPRLR